MDQIRERELKFDVPDGWTVPDLAIFRPESGRLEAATYELAGTYFDSEDALLRRLRVTFRRRSGGADAGWHLKLPTGDARTEVQSRSRSREVPAGFRRRLEGVLGKRELSPIASIETTRRVTRLLDAEGTLVVEVADDTVTGQTLGSEATLKHWREVEVELGPSGDEGTLAALADHLREAGAMEADAPSKVGRLLGPVPAPEVPEGLPTLVWDYLRRQVLAILLGDIALRGDGDEETVHDTRVGIRRLRSTVRMFAPLFPDLSQLDQDLRHVAVLLGEVRDSDILGKYFTEQLDALPPEQVLGPVAQELQDTLSRQRRTAQERWGEGWRSEPYRRSMAELTSWLVDGRPFPDPAATTGKNVLRKARRKLRQRLDEAGADPHLLHRARKAAKRLRYTAELLSPELSDAQEIIDRAKAFQDLLGRHQDLAVAADFLRAEGARAGSATGRNGFTYGLLMARALEQAKELRGQVEALDLP